MTMATAIVPVRREVIDNQFLGVLDDKSKVAIIASEDDLDLLLHALRSCRPVSFWGTRIAEMIDGLRDLRHSAFGE